MWDSADWCGVVFVSDRRDAALRRRERCLRNAAIASFVLIECRPSGAYYKLCVREEDVLDAHLALRVGGLCCSLRLHKQRRGVIDWVEVWMQDVWEGALLLLTSFVDLLWESPRQLTGPDRAPAAS
jgi:hypothetical protein